MKLWVDDIRDVPDDSWTLCNTITQAVTMLKMYQKEITHISLDHDISIVVKVHGKSYNRPSPDTFRVVAQFILLLHLLDRDWIPILTTHSANPVGRKAILDIFHSWLHCDEIALPQAYRELD